jgi:hypothetical protein
VNARASALLSAALRCAAQLQVLLKVAPLGVCLALIEHMKHA